MSVINNHYNYSFLPIANVNNVNNPAIQNADRLLDFLKADPSIKNKKKLVKEFDALPIEQVVHVLETYFNELVKEGKKVDSAEALHRLADVISLKKLETALKIKYPGHQNAVRAAKSLLKEAQYYLSINDKKDSSPIMAKIRPLINSLITCLESVIRAFGVADFFKAPDNDMQANNKSQSIFMLVYLFGMATAALLPILGATITAPIVAVVLLLLAILSLVYPYIKPMPHYIAKAANWTELMERGKLEAAQVKEEYINQICQALSTGKKVKTHPMLIGKSGIGKTEVAKAFVKEITKKETLAKYPEFKGKKVFYINAANLLNGPGRQEGGNRELQKLSDAMGRHRKNIILIIDEIHILCQKKNNVIAEQLKTILDDGYEGFPHVIGITTQMEFWRDIYRNNPAFLRRFKQIHVDNLKEDEVEQILGRTLIQRDPSALIDANALKTLYDMTVEAFPEAAQPAASIKILSQCIKQTSETQKSALEDKINLTQKKINGLIAENVHGQDNLLPYNKKNAAEIRKLEKELAKLEKEFKTYQKEIEELYYAKENFGRVKRNAYKNIVKISKLSKHIHKRDKQLLNEYLLQSHFLLPATEAHIRAKAKAEHVTAVINEALIDEMIQAELKNQEEVQKALQHGKEDENARANGANLIPVK